MDYAVYVAVPPEDDIDRIAAAAALVAPDSFDFSILEREEPRTRTRVELGFRIGGVSSGEEAMARALEIYALSRGEAGLPVDENARASAGIWPASR